MFLRLNRVLARLRSEDRGVALVAVVGVMAVGLLLGSLILSTLIGGMSVTSGMRADVQSQAAAEAGIAAARAGLKTTGDCATRGGVYQPTVPVSSPSYVKFYATTWIRNMSGQWVRGCPAGVSTEVRIISTGDAVSNGIAGNSRGDETNVEAIFNVGLPVITEGPSASAIFTGSGGSVSSLSITTNSNPGDIHILKGDFSCNSGSVINGSIIVADGNANITNTCTITGSVKASKAVTISAAVSVGGDVVAAGGAVNLTNTTITVGGNVYAAGAADIHATVNGNLEATGAVTIESAGWIKGKLLAGGYLWIQGRVGQSATTVSTTTTLIKPGAPVRVGGALKVAGDVQVSGFPVGQASVNQLVNNGWVGSVARNQTGLTGPTAQPTPTVSPWVDWSYDWSDWSSGFQLLNWPSSAGCSVGAWNATTHTIFKQIKNLTTPTLIDARQCSTLDLFDLNPYATVKTDVVFVVKKIQQGKISWASTDGAVHKVWFLVEDGDPNTPGRNCSNGAGDISISTTFEIKAPLTSLAYTPCTVSFSGTKWRGQVYSGAFSVSSGDSMVYEPIGIPGTDLSGGAFIDPNATPAGLGAMTSIRNRADDGT